MFSVPEFNSLLFFSIERSSSATFSLLQANGVLFGGFLIHLKIVTFDFTLFSIILLEYVISIQKII